MSVSVRIPTILRTYTGGESEVSASGETLSAVLDDLDTNYNGIKGRILDESGELRRFVNVYVGNDDVRFLDNLATPTPDGAQISVIPAVLGTVKSGKLRALGVTSAKRTTLLPDLPAISETVPGYEFIGWYSIFAPAKTPAAIVNKLNAGIGSALGATEFRDKFTALGTEPRSSTPQELAAYLRSETTKMRKLVKLSGARPD